MIPLPDTDPSKGPHPQFYPAPSGPYAPLQHPWPPPIAIPSAPMTSDYPSRTPAGKATSIDLHGYTNILTRTLDDRLGPSRTGKICPYPMGCADIEPPKTASALHGM